MALDNLDPNIPLAAGQIQIGGPQQQNALLQMQLRALQLRQAQQSENALRALYNNPANLDAGGRPTNNAIAQLMRVSPQTGLELQGNLAQMDERSLRREALQGQISEAHRKAGYEIGQDVLATYEGALKETGDPKIANQRAMERRVELIDQAKNDGSLPPRAVQGFMPWDPIKYRTAIAGYQAAQQRPPTAHERFEETGKFTLQTDAGRTPAVQYRQYPDGRTTDLQGNPYTPSGIAEPRGAEAQLYKGKIGDKEVTARIGPTGGFVNAETNEPISGLTGIHRVGTKGDDLTKLPQSKQIAVVDKDGHVVARLAARESQSGWVHSEDPSKPVEIPPGGHVDVGQAAGAVIGSRENQMISRQLEGGITATTDLENVSKMPSTVSSGPFGGRKQGPSLVDALKENLANKLTPQQDRIYNAAIAGLQRGLAVIETQGLAPQGAFTEQMNAFVIKATDDQLTALYKLASARQVVENGMEVLSANDRVGPQQRELAGKLSERVKSAIPWTTSDVIKLDLADNPNATLREMGAGKTGVTPAAPTTARQGGQNTESGMRIYQP